MQNRKNPLNYRRVAKVVCSKASSTLQKGVDSLEGGGII
jgi:hypothetical protein